MNIEERFINYVKFDTQSNDHSETTPSTMKQKELAKYLVEELKSLGINNAFMNEYGEVYASIDANCEGKDRIGFIAHMDTAPDCSGKDVKPRIVLDYQGGNIQLNEHVVLSPKEFSNLNKHIGEDLIVTDGTTLLGADDKAGIAIIMNMAEYIMNHPEIEHGYIGIAFTCDEEVGRGADNFDLDTFKCDYAYTVDGGELGDMSYECFHAAGAKLIVRGKSVHPGSAKNILKNAIKLVAEFAENLPKDECPECTEGYEGFYHITDIKGTVEEAVADFIIRDHDRAIFEKRKAYFVQIAKEMNAKYGEELFKVEIKDSYQNMKEMIEKEMHLVENAKQAMLNVGVTPKVSPIRGGTDGARLSFDGLLCPNLCTGSEGHHGRNEFACVEDMEKIVEILSTIVLDAAE